MTTKELQETIKVLLNELGWSVPHLAEVIYTETHDDFEYDEDDLEKFKETLKKQLKRSSTSSEKLEKYLDIISQDREFKKLDMVMPFYVENTNINGTIKNGMKDISKKISKMLEQVNGL